MARGSEYEGRSLMEEFKRGINRMIRQKLMESECSLKSIEQWYKRVTNLDRHWIKSKQEKERLRDRKKIKAQVLRANILANAREA